MANDLDTFVLAYQVEVKDSIARLQKFQEKMEGVGKKSKESKDSLKSFAADASAELGKLVPGLDAVSKAVKGMGAEFAVAGAAIGALALGVKAVMDLRSQYNAQRSVGMQVGVSGTRIEEYQRQFVRGSNGYVTRDAALEGVKTFSDTANAAYTDPSRIGREARIMKMIGVDVGARGKPSTGLNTELTQAAQWLQGKSPAEVQGIAKATGLNQDWLLTLQKLGPAIGQVTQQTAAEIAARKASQDSLDNFNNSLNTLKEDLNELEIKLGQGVIPAMDKFITFLSKIVDLANKITTPNTATGGKIVNGHWVPDHPAAPASSGPRKGHFGPGRTWIEDPLTDSEKKAAAAEESKKAAAAKKQHEQTNANLDKQDAVSKQGVQTANAMVLAINLFASSVQAFSSAIDPNQGWAAWAGEAGKAANLPGSTTTGKLSGGGSGVWVTSPYAPQIKAAAQQTGMDPQMLYAIMQTESHGVNGQYSPTGAGGLMQVTKGNWSKLGNGSNIMDPAANIMVGAQIFKESLARAHGDMAGGLGYYNGNSDPDYVSKVSDNYGRGIGQGRSDLQKRMVQQSLADYLHVPLEQIQQGGVSKGDASWGVGQVEAGVKNEIFNIKRQLSVGGLPQQSYAKLQNDLLAQTRGLGYLEQYKSDVIAKQSAGGRDRTIGERPIQVVINVNGAADPKAVGQAVNDALARSITDLLTEHATMIKG